MENNEPGTHSDKMYALAKSSTRITPQFIWSIYPNWSIIWNIFEKSCHHMSIVHDFMHKGFFMNLNQISQILGKKRLNLQTKFIKIGHSVMLGIVLVCAPARR